MRRRQHPPFATKFLWLFLVLGVLSSLAPIYRKATLEGVNRRVALARSYHELRREALSRNLSRDGEWEAWLEEWRRAGLTALVTGEENLAEYLAEGQVRVENGSRLVTGREDLYARLLRAFQANYPRRVRGTGKVDGTFFIEVDGLDQDLLQLGLAFPRDKVGLARRLGLETYLYVRRPETRKTVELEGLLREASMTPGIKGVIFEGNLAPPLERETWEQWAARGLVVGLIESRAPGTIPGVAAATGYRVVRVYEQPADTPAIEYLLAVRDRLARVIFIRSEGEGAAEVGKVAAIGETLRRAGYPAGSPEPLPFLPSRVLPLALMAAGVAAGLALLARGMWPASLRGEGAILASAAIMWVLALAGYRFSPRFTLKLLAWLAAVSFPVLGMHLAHLYARAGAAGNPWVSLAGFARAAALSLAGGLLVHGLLASTPFWLRLDQFTGVKAAYLAPVALTGWYLWRGGKLSRRQPFQAPALAGFLLALLLVLERSGNQPAVAIPRMELYARWWLEGLLGVRPRTKEFLLGHPALLLGLYLAPGGRAEGWYPFLLLAGVLGQASMVNTLAHLHTPVVVALARNASGLALGLLLGGMAVAAAARRKSS